MFEGLLTHLRAAYKSYKMFDTLVADLYTRAQRKKEMKDSFADDLQILSQKVMIHQTMYSSWRDKPMLHCRTTV